VKWINFSSLVHIISERISQYTVLLSFREISSTEKSQSLRLTPSPVEFQDPDEGLLELLVGKRVAERVERTVQVAEPIGDVVEQRQDAPFIGRAEANDERQDVPRGPADDERSEDDGDRPDRLSGVVLVLRLLRGGGARGVTEEPTPVLPRRPLAQNGEPPAVTPRWAGRHPLKRDLVSSVVER